MPLTLHAALVPSFDQLLASLSGLVDKAEAFAAERGLAPDALIEARLAPDMLPFGYQVKSARVHSWGAIEGVRRGRFSPDRRPWPDSFEGLRALVAETRERLAEVDPDALAALADREVLFTIGEAMRVPFTGDQFLLSFSQPNFYFHVATAYDILRAQGLPIGKRDYLGQPRSIG